MSHTETIVAISTPPGEGGIGVVRLSGSRSIAIGGTLFRSNPALGKRIRHVEYGRVIVDGKALDTALAWVLKGPHSYTGEDTVEISCHGSKLILDVLVHAAIVNGAVLAAPGEFTRRAFLNGRLDLLQAEAVVDFIRANSRDSLESAYGLASGRLSQLVKEIKEKVVEALALLEMGLDFGEDEAELKDPESLIDDLQQARILVDSLIDTFEGMQRRQQGLLIALIGSPNVGKSTLFNALLGEDRAIVTALPGTTRDWLEGQTVWANREIVRLVDTAGLRCAADEIEQEGIARTRKIVAKADFILAILDSSREWQDEDRQTIDLIGNRQAMVVFNKIDLDKNMVVLPELLADYPQIEVSALNRKGLDRLREKVLERIPRVNAVEGIGLTRQRHYDLLSQVKKNLDEAIRMLQARQLAECVVFELSEAMNQFAELLGEEVQDEVLDRIFAEFCIGK